MTSYELRTPSLNQFEYALAGGLSGFITRMLCQPLDVLKIRFQLQVEPISKSGASKYQSIYSATSLIVREEGVGALWKGHIPAQLLSISYGLVQFWCFEVLTEKTSTAFNLSSNFAPLVNFSCGAVAGGCATLVSFPFDVVRTRLVAQSEQLKIYSGTIQAFRNCCRDEGFLVLYRGLWPTIVQIAPHAGVQFMCYKIFIKFSNNLISTSGTTTLSSSLVAGSLAGLCAKTVIYPLDLAKKRMQIQGFERGRKVFGQTFTCKGMNDCLVRICRNEGFFGLFKGLSPSLIKAVVTSALHFGSYEMICKVLKARKN